MSQDNSEPGNKGGQEFVEYTAGESSDNLKDNVVQRRILQGSDELAEARLLSPPQPLHKRMLQLYAACFFVFLCSTMSGYDSTLFSATLVMEPFQKEFNIGIDGYKAGLLSNMYQIGGVISILFIPEALDRFGRRLCIFFGSWMVVLGTILQGTSSVSGSLGQFMAGRVLLGFGVSFCTAGGPTYIVEISQPLYRGIMTGTMNCTWFVGSILSGAVCRASVRYNSNKAWLVPTWCQIIFPAIVGTAILFLPESPRWLYTHNQQDKAKEFLIKYHGLDDPDNAFVKLQYAEFENQLDLNGGDKRWWDYRPLFRSRAARYRMFCAIAMSVFGQWTSGGLGYFLAAFLNTAGITNPETVLDVNLSVAVVNMLSAYAGASFCDRIGRRKLLMTSLCCSTSMWVGLTVGTGVYSTTGSIIAARFGIAFYYLHSMGGAIGITPMQTLYVSEVMAYEQRGKGMAVCSLAVSAASMLNQFAVPIAIKVIGYKLFICYTLWVGLGELPITYFLFPETRNRTLEELDEIFSSKNPVKTSVQKRTVLVDASKHVIDEERPEEA